MNTDPLFPQGTSAGFIQINPEKNGKKNDVRIRLCQSNYLQDEKAEAIALTISGKMLSSVWDHIKYIFSMDYKRIKLGDGRWVAIKKEEFNQQLIANKNYLESVLGRPLFTSQQKRTLSYQDFFTTLSQKISGIVDPKTLQLQEGKVINARIYLPEEIGSSIKDSRKKAKEEAIYIWKNLEIVKGYLPKQLPNVPVDLSEIQKIESYKSELNNYAIRLDTPPQDVILCDLQGHAIGEQNTQGSVPVFREGDNIYYADRNASIMCDQINVSQSGVAFCDGCSLGLHVQQAAQKGVKVNELTQERLDRLADRKTTDVTLRDVGYAQLEAMLDCNEEITKGTGNPADPIGTTTCAQINIVNGYLVGTVVGDSKVFIIRQQHGGERICLEPTEGSRGEVYLASDPGGSLGPRSHDEKHADLRNLSMFAVKLELGDKVIVCSDGVHDNLDPETLGESPLQYDLEASEWDPADTKHKKKRDEVMKEKLLKIMQDLSNPKEISEAIDTYVQNVTKKHKIALVGGQAMRGKSHEEFPGKPDHAAHAVLAYQGSVPA